MGGGSALAGFEGLAFSPTFNWKMLRVLAQPWALSARSAWWSLPVRPRLRWESLTVDVVIFFI